MAESGSQPTVPTLYHLSSSQSFPVLVALEEAAALRGGLEYELKLVPRERSVAPAELKKVHPLGKSVRRPLERDKLVQLLTVLHNFSPS